MEGRNLIVNCDFFVDYLNDFQQKLFTMSWKPIMLFKLERVCCKNVTTTDMRTVSQHPHSYEQAQDQDDAVLLLDLNRGRSASRSNFNHPFELAAYNTGGHSPAEYAKVSSVSVSTPPGGTIPGNSSSITRYPISGPLEVSQNNTAETSIQPMMAPVTPKGAVGIMTNSSMESMIDNQPISNNHVTHLKPTTQTATPENGNPIEEKGKISNPSPNVQTEQLKEQPLTVPGVSRRKTTGKKCGQSVLNSDQATDLTGIANKKQY